jgi:hypothetical protein
MQTTCPNCALVLPLLQSTHHGRCLAEDATTICGAAETRIVQHSLWQSQHVCGTDSEAD